MLWRAAATAVSRSTQLSYLVTEAAKARVPIRILLPWLITLTVGAGSLALAVRQERKLQVPLVYLGYFCLASILQLFYYGVTSNQNSMFWWLELLHNILLCLLSLEIVSHIAPDWHGKLWGFALLATLTINFIVIPMSVPGSLPALATRSLMTGFWLLILVALYGVRMNREYTLITAGILTLLLGDMFASPHFPKAGPWLITFIQLLPVPGLCLIAFAGSKRAQTAES